MAQFIVICNRIAKQSKYKLFFPYHVEVIENIRNLDRDHRSWDGVEKCWTLHTRALYELLKIYRNSDKIHFDFGGVEGRDEFVKQIKKIDIEDAEKERIAKELAAKKDLWVKLKDKLDTDYKKYQEQTHKYLKEEIQLYPYQIAAAMFLNETKSALLALDMGFRS